MTHTFCITFFAPYVGIGWLDETFFASIWLVNLTVKKKTDAHAAQSPNA